MQISKSTYHLKTLSQVLTGFVIMLSFNIANAQTIKKLNHTKANKLNSKAVNLVFISERSKASLISANKILDSAMALDPNYPILYTNKIQNLCKLKDYVQALSVNQMLLKLQPNTPEIIMGNGLILNKLGKTKMAMQKFKESSKIFEKQYSLNPKLTILENLSFNRYLIYNRDSAYALIKREKYRYQKQLRTKNQLDSFTEEILPKLTKDNVL